jgi:hypothetical protein
MARTLRWLATAGLLAALAWSALALHYGGPPSRWRDALAVCVALAGLGLVAGRRRHPRARILLAALLGAVVAWWLALTPRNDRDWQPDLAALAWAEIAGDTVTVHNVRHNDYRTEQDYTVRYEDRQYALSRLRTVDLFLSHWGAPLVAHTVVSFGFDGGEHLAVSIEARKERGEAYSAVAGFFRHYELIYVVADERDVIRLRTSFRGEDVYLYPIVADAAAVRGLFLEYLDRLGQLRRRPEWYGALANNCTTAIPGHSRQRSWRSWKLLANGYLDELAYEIGAVDRSLPFPELRARSRINERARAAGGGPDFSRRIREGLPGVPG